MGSNLKKMMEMCTDWEHKKTTKLYKVKTDEHVQATPENHLINKN
jgi:hypothetical protein